MENRKPLVSIFCSLYKGDDFIEHYLENITGLDNFESYELIIIDGNSPGTEFNIIKEYIKIYKNIAYKRLSKDPGIYGCWNLAIKMSKSLFLNNANVDDVKRKDSIERMLNFLINNPTIDLTYGDSIIADKKNLTFDEAVRTMKCRFNFPEFSYDNLLSFNTPHNSPMYRKSLHDKYGVFNEKYRSAADFEFWLRCASKGSKMAKLDEVLTSYYLNPKGMSTDPVNFDWKIKEEKEISSMYNKNGIEIKGNISKIIKNEYCKI
jgi:GT2 family glycosyltransferase